MPKINKVGFSTRIDWELLHKFRVYCVVNNLYQNEVIEKLISNFLRTKKLPDILPVLKNKITYTTTLNPLVIEDFRNFCDEKKLNYDLVINALIYELLSKNEGDK